MTYSHVPPSGGEFGSNEGDGYGKVGVMGGSTIGGDEGVVLPLPPLPPGPPLPPLPPGPPLPPPLGGGP